MMLDPATVTARIGGQAPELAALRAELDARLKSLRYELEALEAYMAEKHDEFASRFTRDLYWAGEHVSSAWRSLGYAENWVNGR